MNQTYSIDNIVVDFNLNKRFVERYLHLAEMVPHIRSWESRKIASCRINLVYMVDLNNSFYVGISPNWIENGINNVMRIDFNPNKVATSDIFRKVYRDILSNSKMHTIKRIDIAVDYNNERANFFMLKDERKYSMIQNSLSNCTEYLGKRSNHGRVKLYNKQLESKLCNPTTRLEITMDYSIAEKEGFNAFVKVFPKIYCRCDSQMKLEDQKITGTDYVLLMAILDVPKRIQLLERGKKEKVIKLLNQLEMEVKPNIAKFNEAFSTIRGYLRLDQFGDLVC